MDLRLGNKYSNLEGKKDLKISRGIVLNRTRGRGGGV